MRTVTKLILNVNLAASVLIGCSTETYLEGPTPSHADDVRSIEVLPLIFQDKAPISIVDEESVRAVLSSSAFASSGWELVNDKLFEPLYSIEFVQDDGPTIKYWLGTNSYPPRFPCYSFCSGWWVGAMSPQGERIRKGLTSSVYLYLLRDLGL